MKPDSQTDKRKIGSFGQLPENVDATGRMIREERNQPPTPQKKPADIPVPPRKPPILSNADDTAAADFILKQEDEVYHLYKDTEGNVTVGIGHLLKNADDAKKLPFYVYDENDNPLRVATDAEIEKAFEQVRTIPHGQEDAAKEFEPQAKGMQNIRLLPEDTKAVFKRDLRSKAEELRKNWPNFDKLPKELQIGMLDVHFNTGKMTPETWKGLNTAINNRDKEGIIREIHRVTKHENRNKDVQDMLQKMDMQKWR